jgi:heat shock protein HspQ
MTVTKQGERTTYEFTLAGGAQPRFRVGQLVHHKLFDYRGVVVDVHSEYRGTDEWYDEVAKTKPPKDQPWYEVLVNESARVTYVADRNLDLDVTGMPIAHPLIRVFFTEFHRGAYRVGGLSN